jgi:hypothetical protein
MYSIPARISTESGMPVHPENPGCGRGFLFPAYHPDQ